MKVESGRETSHVSPMHGNFMIRLEETKRRRKKKKKNSASMVTVRFVTVSRDGMYKSTISFSYFQHGL